MTDLALFTVGMLVGFSLGTVAGIFLGEAASRALNDFDEWDLWK